ncbi:MAG: molybdate ABC transporter substrate-binding protein [Gammaproteobacteria bacterium]|nr:molybdate ABC transporter substrate-binding protein [Gammaproteobacteria bacterium]
MMRMLSRLLAASTLGAMLASSAAARDSITIFAAASLRDGLQAVTTVWDSDGGAPTRTVLASSSTLARQIEHGAQADLYISANVAWMDYLDERNLIERATRVNLLGNALVLIAPRASDVRLEIAPGFDLAGALGKGLLATGDPAHVPAGIYARQALERLGVWDALTKRLTRSDNVRAALALVARAEAPLGIVYASDAIAEDAVRVVDTFPADSHAPIVYPAAVVAGGGHPDARALLDFLGSPEAARHFERFGFHGLRRAR